MLLGKQVAQVGQLIGQRWAIRAVRRGLRIQRELKKRSGAAKIALVEQRDDPRRQICR
ncbi:MAG: hypothetical protein ACR2IK_19480 [Chloroflexota bacterium]